MAPRVLVVYFSRTGHTRRVAEAIARRLGADLEPIVEPRGRRGLIGWLRSGMEATRGTRVPIAPAIHDPSRYDAVVVGSPVWASRVSSPVRAYLARERARLRRVAFFVTLGGRDALRAFEDLQRLCGQAPLAASALSEHDLDDASAIERLVNGIAEAVVGTGRSTAPAAAQHGGVP